MNDKKHIDRLFQEKLKDFEATPSNAVWENISAEIHTEKKERRVLPLWFKLSAIAAVLLLLFSIGGGLLNTTDKNPDQDTIVNTNTDTNTQDPNINSNETGDNINKIEENKLVSDDTNNIQEANLLTSDSENVKLTQKNNDESNVLAKNNSISDNPIKNSKSQPPNKTKSEILAEATKDNLVAQNDIVQNNNTNNKAINKEVIDSVLEKVKSSENTVTSSKEIESSIISNQDEKINEEEEIATEQEDEKEKTPLDEALTEIAMQDEANDKKKKKEKYDRWKLAPTIAPVYFNTLGSGSSLHEQFNENSKTGNVNMSYGVRGSYALNKKLSVRTGINKVTLGYSTDDIFVLNNVTATPTDQRFQLTNVDLKEDAQGTSFVSVEEFNFAQIPSVISNQIVGSIDQKLGFIEVPMEIEYELSDQKLGLRVLGGVSALFLNENEVFSTLNGETRLIGQATNIKKTSFSANLGVGLDFKLSEKFKLNLEPTFKYQLNTFSNTSGEFKPYFIGIYSGFSFKF